MSLSKTTRNIRIPRADEDSWGGNPQNFILHADCLQDDGTYKESSIDLNDFLGNEDGRFQLFGKEFALTAKQFRRRKGVILEAELQNRRVEWQKSEVDLDLLIANHHGQLCVLSSAVTCSVCKGFLTQTEIRLSKVELERGVSDRNCTICGMLLQTMEHWSEIRQHEVTDDMYCIVKQPTVNLPVIELHAKDNILIETVELYTSEGDPNKSEVFRSIPPAQHFSRSSTSDQSLALVNNWLDDCEKNHRSNKQLNASSCPLTTKCPMPTRVIDVGTSNKDPVRLYTTKGEDAIYACLSHVWGQSKPMVSQAERMDSLQKDGIPWDLLDNTYRDAITFCRKLQIKYLWIDSLCIIQNDGDDWLRESVRMSQYYGNAYLCLAASGSSDHEHGFFVKNEEPLKVSGKGPDDLPYCVFLRLRISHLANGDHEAVSEAFPLTLRGWCYQERRLAPRVLHFGRHEMSFECSVMDRCECGMAGDLTGWTKASEQATFVISDEQKEGFISDEWRKLVVSYSPLHLTKATDRLVAFSGLAQVHSERRQREGLSTGRYIAGMWEDTLAQDMLWHVGSLDDRKNRFDRYEGFRPTTVVEYPNKSQHLAFQLEDSPDYIAPSWSWASILDPLVYQHYEGKRMCKFEQVMLQTKGDDPFGPLTNAAMIIETVVLETKWSFEANEQGTSCRFEHNDMQWRFWPDYDFTKRADFPQMTSKPIFIAAMVEHVRRLFSALPRPCVESIVLRREDPWMQNGMRIYSRIGRASTNLLHDHSQPAKRDDGMVFGPLGRREKMLLA
ncbi:heterokaryon incompatibility protein-domain-containing protein [Xylariaceae sp. FL0016]|nr:heterokaryon incompatibility protein-domain-containing protein [Xylariaceae sp. FL0016]